MPRICFAALLTASCWLGSGGTGRAEEVPPVKVMSFNIRYATAPDGENHWNRRKHFLADVIKDFDPDLFGTQETLAIQRDFLAEQLPHLDVLAAGRDDGKEKGEMAALYWRKERFEKLDGGHFWLSETPDVVGSKGWDAALPRVVTWVKLRERQAGDRKPILFLNTHFDHRGKQARVESMKLLRRRIAILGEGCSIIVTGDFNAGENSEPYRILFNTDDEWQPKLLDTFRVAHPERMKNEGTFNGFNPKATGGPRIDWIAGSDNWTIRDAAIDRTQRDGRVPSDHFPITAELKR